MSGDAVQHSAVNMAICQQSASGAVVWGERCLRHTAPEPEMISGLCRRLCTRAAARLRAALGAPTTVCHPRRTLHLARASVEVFKCSEQAGGACRFGAEIRREINHGGRTSVCLEPL